jgi:SAM-dependent methyltransferase
MEHLIYRELTPWYRLLDPPADHADEAGCYRDAFVRLLTSPSLTLLDIGCGGGHNALHLKSRFRCTLADISPEMLALSKELNPECEHVEGDLRTLRLGRTFDAVLVHDAVMYMRTPDELRAAIATAWVHTRAGGAAIFAPDVFRETFSDETELISGDDGERGLRGISWSHDPDPDDHTSIVDYAFLLRHGSEVRAVHDRHVEGLFAKSFWIEALTAAGFAVEIIPRPIGDGESDEIFFCKRP